MSEEPLPEDLERWPQDPWGVLGVANSADAKTIKRAYTQLIKRFKPEIAPLHFQRIREAYERAQQLLAWRERYAAYEEENEESQVETPPAVNANPPASEQENLPIDDLYLAELVHPEESSHVDQPAPPVSRFPPPPEKEPVELAWQEALAGKTQEAYQRLLRWQEAEQLRAAGIRTRSWQGYAQLYWLLMLYPELDDSRNPCEWLATGFQRAGDSWHLLELFRREVERDPHEAFRPSFTICLEKASPTLLAALLEIRITASSRIHQDDLIAPELQKYRARLMLDDTTGWGRVLITALERQVLAPFPGIDALKPQFVELETTMSRELEPRLERLDLLINMMRDWKPFLRSHVRNSWKQFLFESFVVDETTNEQRLEKILAEIAADPLGSLNELGYMYKRHTAAAYLFFDHLERCCARKGIDLDGRGDAPEEVNLTMSLRKLLRSSSESSHDISRALLSFCIAECIALVPLYEKLPPEVSIHISMEKVIREERHVHYIYAAWRAFWKLA